MLTAAAVPRPADALLATGAIVTLRPTSAEDRGRLTEFYARCSCESRRRRFFTLSALAPQQDVERLLQPPSLDHLGVVAITRGDVIATGCIERTDDNDTAEFAMLVDDTRHGEGVGTLLLEYLVAAGRDATYRRLRADVLSDNTAMLKVINALGATVQEKSSHGVVTVEFGLEERPGLLDRIDYREEVAEHASIGRLLSPRSIAVVGAGDNADGVGHRILANLHNGGFTGRLYAVNKSGVTPFDVPTVASVRDLSPAPDLAVIAVPAVAVLDVIDDCASAGVYGAVIVSDGFAELGTSGSFVNETCSIGLGAQGYG